MTNLEQGREDSIDLNTSVLNESTQMDNTKKAMEGIENIDGYAPIEIKENFDTICNMLKNGTELEKELAKTKLLYNLANNNIKMDSNTTIANVREESGERVIILEEDYVNGVLRGKSICTLKYKNGQWYYKLLATA